jgi:predicted RND superfamily exporter protein
MSAPQSPVTSSRQKFFQRRFAPLITSWVTALIVAGLVYWFETEMPAFHDVVMPFYWIIGLSLAFVTWRWIRTRGKRDRRSTDRRHADRRDTAEHSTQPPVN